MLTSRLALYFLQLRNRSRAFFDGFSKTSVSLVEEPAFEELLDQAGLRDSLSRGEGACSQCGKQLSLDDVAGFVVEGSTVSLLCDAHGPNGGYTAHDDP